MASSSAHEVETQCIIAHRLGYVDERSSQAVLEETEAESRMLMALMNALRA